MPCQSNRFSMMMMMVFWPGVDAAKPSHHLHLLLRFSSTHQLIDERSSPAEAKATPAWKSVMIKSSKRRAHPHTISHSSSYFDLFSYAESRPAAAAGAKKKKNEQQQHPKRLQGGRSGSVRRVRNCPRGVPERTAKCSPEASCFLPLSPDLWLDTYVVLFLFLFFYFFLKLFHFLSFFYNIWWIVFSHLFYKSEAIIQFAKILFWLIHSIICLWHFMLSLICGCGMSQQKLTFSLGRNTFASLGVFVFPDPAGTA